MYNPVDTRVNFPKLEEEILAFWEKNDIFKKSIAQREGAEEFVFYDGPPFATGLPHFGHFVPGTIKDIIARYQTTGRFAPRNLAPWLTRLFLFCFFLRLLSTPPLRGGAAQNSIAAIFACLWAHFFVQSLHHTQVRLRSFSSNYAPNPRQSCLPLIMSRQFSCIA
jgi:hypothetical protein